MEEKLTSDHPLAVQSIDAPVGLAALKPVCGRPRGSQGRPAKLARHLDGRSPLSVVPQQPAAHHGACAPARHRRARPAFRASFRNRRAPAGPFTSETPAPARFRLGNLSLPPKHRKSAPSFAPHHPHAHNSKAWTRRDQLLRPLAALRHAPRNRNAILLERELDESGQHKGPSRVRHRVEVFRSSIDDTDDAAYDELGVLSDEPSWLVDELKKKSQHLPIAYAERSNAFDDDLRVGPERTAVLLKWMTERLISSARLTAQQRGVRVKQFLQFYSSLLRPRFPRPLRRASTASHGMSRAPAAASWGSAPPPISRGRFR